MVQQTNNQTNKQTNKKRTTMEKKVRNTGKKANQNPEIEVMK